MNRTLEIKAQLPRSGLGHAARILADAFNEDPLFVELLPNEMARNGILRRYFATLLESAEESCAVWRFGDPIVGVIVCVAPHQNDTWTAVVRRAYATLLPEILGDSVSDRLFRVLAWLERRHNLELPEAHWYLMVLGVEPCMQNRGVGSALVQHVLSLADEVGTCCYVETQEKRNVSFYRRLGFVTVLDGETEPATGLSMWTFVRSALKKAPRTTMRCYTQR